jgi:hypothetical protein
MAIVFSVAFSLGRRFSWSKATAKCCNRMAPQFGKAQAKSAGGEGHVNVLRAGIQLVISDYRHPRILASTTIEA